MNTKQTVCIVSETYRPEVNGVANTLGYWVDGLVSKGYRIQVVRPRQNKDDRDSDSGGVAQVTTTGLPIPKYPELKFGLPSNGLFKKLWSRSRPVAVYIATEGPLGWSAKKVARKLGIPVISGFHTNFQSYSQFYGWGWLEKLIMGYLRSFHNRTRKTLVPTKCQAQYLIENGFKNTQVISRGVDCQQFTPNKRDSELRKQWGADEDTAVCIYVGRLAHEKNVQLIATYIEQKKEHSSPVKFVFVGDGPARSELEKRCPDAVFSGMRRGDDLARHYASADIFLFPSKTDTFGNVVTEALASELTIVAFDDAAAKEHLRHDFSGLIAPLSDDSEYLSLVKHAIDSKETRSRIRSRGLEVARGISWDSITEQFERCLVTPNHSVSGDNYEHTEKLNTL